MNTIVSPRTIIKHLLHYIYDSVLMVADHSTAYSKFFVLGIATVHGIPLQWGCYSMFAFNTTTVSAMVITSLRAQSWLCDATQT